MEYLNKKVYDLVNTYLPALNKKNEVYQASVSNKYNFIAIDNNCHEISISILLKEELLNDKDVDLFDITIEYSENEDTNIYIYEISICTSDGIVYLEFSKMTILKEDFIRFIKLFLDEAIRLYEKNVISYLNQR